MENSRLKIGITSTAIAFACAGATYAFLRYKYRLLDAAKALNYLTIKTVTSEEVCDEVVHELRKRTEVYRALGFDCEWVTEHGRRQPVALIQLSTFDGLCGLFRLNLMKTIPQSLKALLEDVTLYKVGVAPYDDGKYLQQDYSVELKSTLDIRHLAELCGYNPGGLGSLSQTLLRVVLDKSWRIRCSDWAAKELTDRQINYAAADAHVAIRIFFHLVQENQPSSWFNRKKSDVWSNIDNLCWKYADVHFKAKTKVNSSEKREAKNKEKAVLSTRYPSHATRTKPLYHNCFLEAPDGEVLCTSDNKKALWYVEKELADIVCEDPLRIRLRFEPSGRSVGDVGKYYTLAKENKCVVCGSEQSYIRKNVVPREYRKYFPDIMKEHSSHDVVLLCVHCHKLSNVRDQAVRERLAVQCHAALPRYNNRKFFEDEQSKKLRAAARTLQFHSDKLPETRRKEFEGLLLQHFPLYDEITQELLEEAKNLQVIYENSDYESHGKKVVEYFLEQDGGLLKLEELWREHFLTTMRPKYMPELWSTKHNEEKLRVKFNEGRVSEEDLKLIGLTSRWLY